MRKLIAGFMTAFMALLTVSAPVLAVSQLGSYPTFLKGADNTLSAYVVVGAAANVADVVGAVDVASRLAEVGKATVTQSCSGASGAVTGTSKDNVPLTGVLSNTFPASGVLKEAHYSGLKDSTYSWRGTDYDYREQVDISAVSMRHALNINNVNGSEKMEVQSGDVIYEYVFDETLNGTGSYSVPNYTYPISISLLGKAFQIVGVSDGQVKMLQGSIGTATATTPVVYGTYSVYSDLGFSGASTSSGNWARIIIKDANGNTVDTQTINQGDNKQSTATGLTIMLTTVRALSDGTVVGADLVIGPTADGVTKTYDTTADVTSTGTSSDVFPGDATRAWGIQVGSGSFDDMAGSIVSGDKIQVIYKPTTVQYIAAGSKVSLPNEYGDLGFTGFNTDKFATISIVPLGSTISAYSTANENTAIGDLNGIEITADVTGSLVSSVSSGYTKAYVLWNYTRGEGNNTVYFGFYDTAKSKIFVNPTAAVAPSGEYKTFVLGDVAETTYDLTLSYGNAGDTTFNMRFYFNNTNLLYKITSGSSAGNGSVVITYTNATAASTTQAPTFILGTTALTTEVDEVKVVTEGSLYNAGKKTQEVVSDSGIIVASTETYGASETVKLKVPFKALAAVVYFGKQGTGTGAGSISYTSYPSIPITSTIAKLDSEIGAAEKAKNLITVGGSCVNSVTADALGLTYPSCGVSSTIPENQGLVKVVDSPYAEGTGKVVVVVAGWEAANTRAACSVLQLYDTKLAGVTASAVTVTGTVGAPSVTPV